VYFKFINKCGSKVYLSLAQNKGTLARNHIGVFPLFLYLQGIYSILHCKLSTYIDLLNQKGTSLNMGLLS